MHHDPILSKGKRCLFSFGHNWVVLSIQLRFAFAPDKVWSLEVAFYNAKQFLGLEDPQNRTRLAVRRTAPPALYLHTMVILWFAKQGRFNANAYRRAHPWYTRKRTPSFADMPANLKAASLRESISRYPGQKPPSLKKLPPLFQALEAAA